jgi:hypothetical protein
MRHVEPMEPRRLLAAFTASSVAELIADINAANAAGGSNTITLTAGSTFKLNAVDNTTWTDGPNGLPVIAAGNDLTIVGNGDAIQRSTATGTPAFRLFDVSAGGSLSLNNLSLSRGLESAVYLDTARGGAVLSLGTLSLNGVTVQGCIAQGQPNKAAYGGGIYSGGVLTVANSSIQNNQALGGDGSTLASYYPQSGASAGGGGLYVAAGSASLTNLTVDSNLARGGNGANGGKVYPPFSNTPIWVAGGGGGGGVGGGIYAATGTVAVRGTTNTRNTATGGAGGSSPKGLPRGLDGTGQGGAIYIAPAASVGLDAFTQSNTRGNSASTSDNDIFGTFTIL